MNMAPGNMPGASPGLEALGLVGNCQVAMLVDRAGSVVWGCWPRLDADPMFCALLTADPESMTRGTFAIELLALAHSEVRYRRNTAILETLLTDQHGNSVRVIDCCPRFRMHGRMFRPAMLVRRIEPVAGRPLVRIRLRPCENYGAAAMTARTGSHHIRFAGQDQAVRLTTDASLSAVMEERSFILDTALSFVLGPDETLTASPHRTVTDFIDETDSYWREWVRSLAVPYEWQEAVIRAAITLKLCTFEDTGAIIAAVTSSIPEAAATERTWDYRYCWLRDGYFTVQALNRLGATRTLESFLRYLESIVAQEGESTLQPVYGISGERILQEREAPALDGYGGHGPVRVGNLAYQQRQHDVYGSVVLASTQAFFDERLTARGDVALFERLEVLGERATLLCDQPDAGIWEFRGTMHRHTFSAAMCWAACDRLSRIAERLTLPAKARLWRHRANELGSRILAQAWHEGGGFLSARLDGQSLDASLLLLPELGLLDWKDPRFLSTLAVVERELQSGGFLLRYTHEDDFGAPANAFLVCSFWWANALTATGRMSDARALFERLLAARNAVGLLSEDLDPLTGRLWGNFPQTYSMVGIITTAMRLSRRWEDAL